MLDASIYFIILNVSLLTTLFWLLSFFGEKFFKVKFYKNSTELFECGFLSTHNLNFTFNLNFLIAVTLLILYDVEFFFLIPYLFNQSLTQCYQFIIFLVFYVFIYISFLIDWESLSFEWSF